MKNQLLALIAAGSMVSSVSQVQAMSQTPPALLAIGATAAINHLSGSQSQSSELKPYSGRILRPLPDKITRFGYVQKDKAYVKVLNDDCSPTFDAKLRYCMDSETEDENGTKIINPNPVHVSMYLGRIGDTLGYALYGAEKNNPSLDLLKFVQSGIALKDYDSVNEQTLMGIAEVLLKSTIKERERQTHQDDKGMSFWCGEQQ